MSTKNQVNIVDEIKSRCNIVDVIGRVVPLKKTGSNYKGVCPFHNEKTPSFVVSESKQIFTCFGCGATGDVIAFVRRYYNLEFRGAVEMLAREYGINLDGVFRNSRDKDELYEINRQTARYFYRSMREKPNKGYTYMRNRGISDETLNIFGIGYADGEWTSLYDFLKSKGITEKKMMELGLISNSKGRYFDKFRDRVVFPIINTAGKVIGFGGRAVGDVEPKYLNSQESSVFQKKNNLYGLNLTRNDIGREDAIILVEGYMDVVSLYQAGIRNVSASLGTALTENQARLIKRYTRNVILSYDADQAGQNAAMRGIDILYKEGCRAKVLKVTEGKDPDEFVKKNGKSAFHELVAGALSYGDFKLSFTKAKYDMTNEEQRLDFLKEAVGILQSMKPVEADFYIKKLAKDTGISEGAIRFEYSGNNSQEKKMPLNIGTSAVETDNNNDVPLVEQDLIKLMLIDDKYVKLPEDVEDIAFVSTAGRNIYRCLVSSDDGHRPFDINRLKDILDADMTEALDVITSKIIPEGREDSIYHECLERIRVNELKKKEAEIIARLSMADEEENGEEIVKLTKQLMDIQKQIKM